VAKLLGSVGRGRTWECPVVNAAAHNATPSVAEAATDAYNAAWRWGHSTTFGGESDDFHTREIEYGAAEAALLEQIRLDLRIPKE